MKTKVHNQNVYAEGLGQTRADSLVESTNGSRFMDSVGGLFRLWFLSLLFWCP